MIAHTGVTVRQYKKSKPFYAKVLAPLGYKLKSAYPKYKAAGFGETKGADFWIGEGKRGIPTHVAFVAKNKNAVDGFYRAAIKAGAKDNGAPGYRKHYSPGYYAAYIYDLDGNNIEALWMDPKPKK